MEKKKLSLKNSKLSLKKETLAQLNNEELNSVRGGEYDAGSTCHKFTCSWCTGDGGTGGSTRSDFTCSWCTTITVVVTVQP